jgi:non-heme chloroperoxidase
MHRTKPVSFRAASVSRREVLGGMSAVGSAAVLSMTVVAPGHAVAIDGDTKMASIKTSDGTEIFYKDWGPKTAQPIVFHHGWPLSADDWDNQMMFFLSHGYRVIAHDRRGHGRSTQTDIGNEMNTYASDVAVLANTLKLQNAVHVGHSAGGGEVARYVATAKPGRVASEPEQYWRIADRGVR